MSGALTMLGAGLGVGTGAFGMGLGHHYYNQRAEKEYRYNRKMARYGHDLQYDMWKKTNYPAQVEMLKAAGLNPALMYGMSGGGGTTTGSQTGSPVSGGSGVGFSPMDMSNIMKVGAEIDLINAQKDKVKSETEVNVKQAAKLISDKLLVEQQKSESEQREANLVTENEIKQHDRDWLKKNNISTYDVGIIRLIKSVIPGAGNIQEAMDYYLEHGDEIKLEINLNERQPTGKPDGKGGYIYREGYIWNDRIKDWIQI